MLYNNSKVGKINNGLIHYSSTRITARSPGTITIIALRIAILVGRDYASQSIFRPVTIRPETRFFEQYQSLFAPTSDTPNPPINWGLWGLWGLWGEGG
ncbi:MAG: hypothetical protein F6J93_07975 [Oscillatoria sp. SIO1A7]|nr:hypothetical protein [Oscillatoria sp. SIO1A7]